MKKQSFNFLEGETLVVNKPLNWTSFDVVNKLRFELKKHLGIKKIKVGHAGTLDPLATGVLVICTGKNTKKIESFQSERKEYTGTITLGATTPSFDLETEIDQSFDISDITETQLLDAAKKLTGELLQTPPVFSAKKINGKKAYELARKGKEVEMRKSLVEVFAFELTKIELPNIEFRIECSKGTYIRSMAHDFGKLLNNGAHLSKLERTKSGNFYLENAYELEELIAQLQNT